MNSCDKTFVIPSATEGREYICIISPQPKKPRIFTKQRLHEKGLTEEDLSLYKSVFVTSIRRYWSKVEGESWLLARNKKHEPIPLKDRAIAIHLQGHEFVAREMGRSTDFFVVDLDLKNGVNLREGVEATSMIFGTPLVIRSSSSGGLHLYYFLRHRIFTDGLAGSLRAIFKLAGRPLTRRYEVFPVNVSHLRLPLGEGSIILDASTLEPIKMSLSASIRFAAQHKRDHTIDIENIYQSICLAHWESLQPKEQLPQKQQVSYIPQKRLPLILCGRPPSRNMALVTNDKCS